MATNRNKEHLRYRYGMCLNDGCQKCKNKEVQQISARKDFVCEECGKALRECPPPPPPPPIKLIIIVAVVILGAAVGLYYAFSGNDAPEKTEVPAAVDTTAVSTDAAADSTENASAPVAAEKRDTVVVKETVEVPVTKTVVVKEPKQTQQAAAPAKSNGKLSLSYGNYSGDVKNGNPHGQGRMTYTSSHQIDSRDPKARVAEPGDYVIGEWSEGKLVQGRWYDSSNNVKGSIIIGM